MKSCVSLHRFRINADPPGGGFNLGNYGDGLRPSVLSAPAQKSCAFLRWTGCAL